MLASQHSGSLVAAEAENDSATIDVAVGVESFQFQQHTAAGGKKSAGTRWAPSVAELNLMNEWNPTGHQGRTAGFVLHIKSMFSTGLTTKYYQDQLTARCPPGAKIFQFTPSPYLNNTWDKMTDPHRVKWLIWYNKLPIPFVTGALASFLAPQPPRTRIPPAPMNPGPRPLLPSSNQ